MKWLASSVLKRDKNREKVKENTYLNLIIQQKRGNPLPPQKKKNTQNFVIIFLLFCLSLTLSRCGKWQITMEWSLPRSYAQC